MIDDQLRNLVKGRSLLVDFFLNRGPKATAVYRWSFFAHEPLFTSSHLADPYRRLSIGLGVGSGFAYDTPSVRYPRRQKALAVLSCVDSRGSSRPSRRQPPSHTPPSTCRIGSARRSFAAVSHSTLLRAGRDPFVAQQTTVRGEINKNSRKTPAFQALYIVFTNLYIRRYSAGSRDNAQKKDRSYPSLCTGLESFAVLIGRSEKS